MFGYDEFVEAATRFLTFVRALIAAKRAVPGPDLLSATIAARDGEDKLSENELTSMAFVLVVAGYETTANLIANGAVALLRHPEQLAQLRVDPTGWPTAVEAAPIRRPGPVHPHLHLHPDRSASVRREDPGWIHRLRMALAANRDRATFLQAHQSAVRRSPAHMGFGHGIRYCIGAPARLGSTDVHRAVCSGASRTSAWPIGIWSGRRLQLGRIPLAVLPRTDDGHR